MHRVVIIDDEKDVARIHAFYLRSKSFHTEVVHSGADGLRLVDEFSPALVICDMRMPGMEGDEVFRTLRAQSHTRHIPVLIISAHSSEQCDGVGDAHLQKPFQLADLMNTIQRLIAGASSPWKRSKALGLSIRFEDAFTETHDPELIRASRVQRG